MGHLEFETINERLVNLSSTDLMIFLNRKENHYLKAKITRLIFKSHSYLSNKNNTFQDWSDKVKFFQYIDNFLNYLYSIQK